MITDYSAARLKELMGPVSAGCLRAGCQKEKRRI